MTEFHGFLCSSPVYEFEGITFEYPAYAGPWPLKKNGDPKQRAGRKFYALVRRFEKMPDEEQEKHRVYGGCVRF